MKIRRILDYLESNEIDCKYYGDLESEVIGYSSLKNYKTGSLTWIGRLNAVPARNDFDALQLVVVEEGLNINVKNGLYVKNSKEIFFSIIEDLFENKRELPELGQGCYIGSDVVLGEGVKIGHNCVLDGDITIGNGTVIYNNVNIVNHVVIGKNCVIQSGVSIGHDGFGYSEDEFGNKKMVVHHGGVAIGNDVYISANSVIQRGTIDDTIIESGTKIDTLCHIAHNVHIGKKNGIVTLSALYGSCETGENCYIASGIIKDNTKIGNNVQIGVNAVVMNDVGNDMVLIGTPAKKLRDKIPYVPDKGTT